MRAGPILPRGRRRTRRTTPTAGQRRLSLDELEDCLHDANHNRCRVERRVLMLHRPMGTHGIASHRLLVPAKVEEFRDAHRAPEVARACLGNGDHHRPRRLVAAIAECPEVPPATWSAETPEAERNDLVLLHEAR